MEERFEKLNLNDQDETETKDDFNLNDQDETETFDDDVNLKVQNETETLKENVVNNDKELITKMQQQHTYRDLKCEMCSRIFKCSKKFIFEWICWSCYRKETISTYR